MSRAAAYTGFATAVIGLAALTTRGGVLGVGAGSLLVVAVGGPTALRLRTDILDAPGLYAAVTVVGFGLTSFQWIGTPPLAAPGITADEVSNALLLVSAALLAFGIVTRIVAPARRRAQLELSVNVAPSASLLLAVFALGILGSAVALYVGAAGYQADQTGGEDVVAGGQFLRALGTLSVLAVLITAVTYFGSGIKRYRTVLMVTLLVQVAFGFLVGFKGSSLTPVLLTLLAYIACKRRIPWRAIIVVTLATFLLLVPGNLAYRQFVGNEPPATATASSSKLLPTLRRSMRRAEIYARLRFRYIDSVALIMDLTPGVYPRGSGSRYWTLPQLILVPRVVWPDKPLLDDGGRFAHTYWEIPRQHATSIPLTQVGDLYRNFGRAGVGVGVCLWGLGIALFLRASWRWRSPRFEAIYLYSLATWVTYVESDLPELIVGAAKTMPVALVVAWALLPGRQSLPGYRRIAPTFERLTPQSISAGAKPQAQTR
jgi:hypothetical protein